MEEEERQGSWADYIHSIVYEMAVTHELAAEAVFDGRGGLELHVELTDKSDVEAFVAGIHMAMPYEVVFVGDEFLEGRDRLLRCKTITHKEPRKLVNPDCPECKGDPNYFYQGLFSGPQPCKLCSQSEVAVGVDLARGEDKTVVTVGKIEGQHLDIVIHDDIGPAKDLPAGEARRIAAVLRTSILSLNEESQKKLAEAFDCAPMCAQRAEIDWKPPTMVDQINKDIDDLMVSKLQEGAQPIVA